jgi:hypothetical protein
MRNINITSKYMHISIDDVNTILKELTEGSFNSIYEHKVLRFFKELHERYGAVFSLYCYYENQETPEWTLENMTEGFKKEFEEAAVWLKFGFHALNSKTKYDDSINTEEAVKHYDSFIRLAEAFAGSSSIDIIPRIHFFAGTEEQARCWRDTKKGIKGFLSADDSRAVNAYLDEAERKFLEENSVYFEEKEELYFLRTNLRLEKVSDAYKALEEIKLNPTYEKQQNVKIIFTHECYLSDEAMLNKIEDCCKWAIQNEFAFEFPMNFL